MQTITIIRSGRRHCEDRCGRGETTPVVNICSAVRREEVRLDEDIPNEPSGLTCKRQQLGKIDSPCCSGRNGSVSSDSTSCLLCSTRREADGRTGAGRVGRI